MPSSLMKRIVPLLYTSVCSIFVQKDVVDSRMVTRFEEVLLYENLPCRISYVSHIKAKAFGKVGTDLGYEATQKVKLFLDPDVVVPTGAIVVISGRRYMYSGASAVYSGHQEIVMMQELDC